MKAHLITTIVCPDRPGIVERITQVVAAHNANWEQSRMARLGGDFAGIVVVSVDADRVEALTAGLRGLEDHETTVTVRSSKPPVQEAAGERVPFALRLSGADHMGIVHEVARSLAARQINVEQLVTEVVPAPVSGTPLFRMEAVLLAPPAVTLEALRSQLARLAGELSVDLDVDPAI